MNLDDYKAFNKGQKPYQGGPFYQFPDELEGKKVDDSVVDQCIENLLERKRQGLIRYGKILGKSTIDKRSPITEAREEAEDLVVYLTWEEHQREKVFSFLSTLMDDVEKLLSHLLSRNDLVIIDGKPKFAGELIEKLWLDMEQGKEIREVLRTETGENSGRAKCGECVDEVRDIRTEEQTCQGQTGE